MEKLVVKKQMPKDASITKLRLGIGMYEKLREVSDQANMSMRDMAEILLDFAIKHLEIEEVAKQADTTVQAVTEVLLSFAIKHLEIDE